MLINQVKNNSSIPTGMFYGNGIRFHGDNNQLVVLNKSLEKIGPIDGKQLNKLDGKYYPFGSLFG